MPPENTVGTHGLGAFGESRRKATVGVLAGRNPALPGLPLQGPGCLEDFPYEKKKVRVCCFVCQIREMSWYQLDSVSNLEVL